MRLAADEGVDRPIVQALRERGHDIWYVAEEEPAITDDQVLARADELDAPLLTCDKDFGELTYRLGRTSKGVVLIRLAGLSAADKAAIVCRVIDRRGSELRGSFVVITSQRVRFRRLS